MVDQVKLNNGDMICHLMKVSSWLCDTTLFPISYYPTKSVDAKFYLCILLLVSPLPGAALEIKIGKSFFMHAKTRLAFEETTSEVCWWNFR